MKLGRITTALALAASAPLCATGAILVDYDDGVAGGGHDAAVLAGDMTGLTDASFTPWVSLGTGAPQFRTNNAQGVGSANNYVATLDRILGIDTGYTIQAGDSFDMEFSWRDAANWDADDTMRLVLFYTADNTIGGTATDIATLDSGGRVSTSTWETESASGVALSDAGAVGNTLFARLESNSAQGEFSRVDNIYIDVSPVPEPGSLALLGLGGLTLLRRRR
ncbi:PEP-CTERM sorting domain-containing protein [Phycisphaeraceae bacterium D3-23]